MRRYKKQFKEAVYKTTTEFDTENPSDEQILRMALSAEQSAINLYKQLANFANDRSVQELLLDIAKEEQIHVGEFQYLLQEYISIDDLDMQMIGSDEVEELMNTMSMKDGEWENEEI